jgi:PAS domain S-box-containing protein
VAVCGTLLILLVGASVILNLVRGAHSGVSAAEPTRALQLRAVRVLSLLSFLTAGFLVLIFVWTRRRVLGELDGLVRIVEDADPDRPGRVDLPLMRVAEFERLRLAFLRFFDRFTASRARQEEVEATLGPVLDHAADAIFVLDRGHRIISWNRGAEETFGFPEREILGEPYATLTPAGEEEPELKTLLAPGATVKDLRTRRVRRDGRTLEVSLTRSRVPAPEGGDERFVEIVRDISETRRMEEDWLRTEKMAAVGKISSKVVHEIRNPLASINLNVDLLQDSLATGPGGEPDPEAQEMLGIIKREIRRLSQITEEYLQFSRLPRAEFRPERVNDILIELSDLIRPSISRRGIRLVLNLDDSDPEAVCDATLIRQALLNLLRNAMDASEDGRGQIQMSTRALLDAAGELPTSTEGAPARAVEITVEDAGHGIAPDKQDKIFEPFFTTKKAGTGLGLALVRRAVDEHGGRIQCVSVLGKGTTFRLLLPCEQPVRIDGGPAVAIPPLARA